MKNQGEFELSGEKGHFENYLQYATLHLTYIGGGVGQAQHVNEHLAHPAD